MTMFMSLSSVMTVVHMSLNPWWGDNKSSFPHYRCKTYVEVSYPRLPTDYCHVLLTKNHDLTSIDSVRERDPLDVYWIRCRLRFRGRQPVFLVKCAVNYPRAPTLSCFPATRICGLLRVPGIFCKSKSEWCFFKAGLLRFSKKRKRKEKKLHSGHTK